MSQRIANISLLVNDYDEAIQFYTEKLKFNLIEDTDLGEGKRWVLIAPQGNSTSNILLAKAEGEEQKNRVGDQTGGRVFLFLFTDNLDRDYQSMLDHGVKIIRDPSSEVYGKVLVFSDLYGNLWDLIEPSSN